jgi:drug/metabolite transporter (DMT)-like permease
MPGPGRPQLVLCLATVYLVWGSSYLAARIGVMHLPPLLFGGIRFLAAGVLLGAFALWRGLDIGVLRREWRHIVVLGVVGIAFVNGLQVWALQWVPSHGGALLNASCAFWIVTFGLFGRRAHRPSALALTGIGIGFLGTALLIWPEAGTATVPATPLVPQLGILVACVGWAAATIYMRNIDTALDVFALTALQMLFGGLVLCLLGLAIGEGARFELTRPGLLAMAWLTVFSSCFAYTAYAWLAQNASPAQTGTYSYVNPVIASVLGYLVLDERMTPLQLMASGIVVVGVILVNWPTSVTMRRSSRAT